MNYDLIVIGSGPGGYVASIRASQLGMKVALVEKETLGGICLNWGCIPTKALLKSAQVFDYVHNAKAYGVEVAKPKVNFSAMVDRSREVAGSMSKGVEFLMKKNKVEVIAGKGMLAGSNKVTVTDSEGKEQSISAKHIILATGARSRELPSLKQDGKSVIGYRQALSLPKQPKSMVVVGSGPIGSEFAYFYNAIGTKVTLIEMMPNVLPLEDEEVSKTMGRAFKKAGVKVLTEATVKSVSSKDSSNAVTVETKKGEEVIEAEVILSAVGITPNIEGIGLEDVGVKVEDGRIAVDEYYRTSAEGIYAIGDIIKGPALAHVASAEATTCVEAIAGLKPKPINYKSIPGCTYTSPEVASVGLTESAAKEAGYEIKVGKFPFTASGKATAAGHRDGFVKLVFDAKYGELLGAHMVGANVTEMIAEIVVAQNLETTAHELIKSIHPHPTLSEAIMEAAAAAEGEAIHV